MADTEPKNGTEQPPQAAAPAPAPTSQTNPDEEVIMIAGGRRMTASDVTRDAQMIEGTRRMSDEDVRTRMHSARPKQHELEVHKAAPPEFVPAKGFTTKEANELLAKWGRNELEEKEKPKWKILLEQFTAPMPCMIWVAILVEGALQSWPDFGILCALQAINGFVGFYETNKAGNAVAALKASLKPVAHVKRDGKWITIESALVVPGDLVLLGSGAAVPADCIVNEGQIDVDQSALTGESMPVTMGAGDGPKMGSTVTRGEVEATVEATGMNTFFGKTASLIQSVDGMGHLAKVLLNIMVVLLVMSFVLCGICLGVLLANDESFKEAIKFVVVLLVASIPVAMEVVVTTTLALGSRELVKMDAIVARLSAIEELSGMNMLCSDKTGTLTLNKMVIQDDCPVFQEGIDREDVILHAALAAKWREPPKDALDTMVLGVANLERCDNYKQLNYVPFDPVVKRTEATLQEIATGKEFSVTKGAPHVVLSLCHNKEKIEGAVNLKVMELAERGIRSLSVARTNDEGQWEMMGILTFLDPPRPDTKRTIERAMEHGVDVKMITGDHAVIARETARQLGMGTKILASEGLPSLGPNGEVPSDLGATLGPQVLSCNGFAQVFPEHKFLIVEALRQQGFKVGMTGDGVNDAPALKKADVGIAVQGATDAARASADIVLKSPGLSVVVDAIIISRCIFARMKNFIIYRVACTFQLLVFFFISVLALRPEDYNPEWPAFWGLPVIALILITLLNDGTIISIAYDVVVPNKRPDDWNLPSIYLISAVLGAVACVSSLICLYLAFDSEREDSLFRKWGIVITEYGQVQMMLYLKVSLSDFLTLFASRSRTWFWDIRPGKLLAAAFFVAVGASTALACTWPFGEGAKGINSEQCAFVWIYCLVWFIIQDAVKVLLYKVMYKYNILDINRSTSHLENYAQDHFEDSKHSKGKRAAFSPMRLMDHVSKHKSPPRDGAAANPAEAQV